MRVTLAFRGVIEVLRALFPLVISCVFLAQPILHARAQSMASSTRPDEVDTADHPGGQIGGARMGVGYRLATMRCGSGQVMVGAAIRRGEVLRYVQIVCATPSCAGSSCAWSSAQLGMSAGNSGGGVLYPAMMCRSNEILSGIQGRVLVFRRLAVFDYAADLEVLCSQMASPAVTGPSGQQFYPVSSSTGSGHASHDSSSAPAESGDAIEGSRTEPITCASRGYGATAVSVAVSSFIDGHPVVQAVSLFCPRIAPTAARPRPQERASTGRRKQTSDNVSAASPQSPLDFGSAVESHQKSAGTANASLQSSQLTAALTTATSGFRLMTPQDSMWANKVYAGTLGYFPGKSYAHSSCHGFIGEMGVATPGANLCGNQFVRNLPQLPAGTPHQLGDIAIVADAGAPAHSAIFIGCNLYLQRNGGSDIQVISQSYLDNFISNEQTYYVRPTGLGTFTVKLAALKSEINQGEGIAAADQAAIAQIKGCFPN